MKASSSDNNIIISGDSWGCGEWGYDGKLLHKGLEQYLLDDGKQVTNCSVGGYSNENSINDLRKLLETYTDDCTIFWIQTDPIRDIRPFWRLPDNELPYRTLPEEIQKHNGYDNLCRALLRKHYTELNSLGRPIHLIGGKWDIDTTLLEGLNNLKPTVISWVKLLVGHIEKYNRLFPFRTASDYIAEHFKFNLYTDELRYRVVDEFHYTSLCWQIFDENTIFHPDKGHPNRDGHYKLFEYLKKELTL